MSKLPSKVVSKAQYRYFRDMLRRAEAGEAVSVNGMTLDDLRYALEGVDFDSLPERAASKFKKPRKATKSQQPPVVTVAPPLPTSEPLPEGVLSFEDFLSRYPARVPTASEPVEPGKLLSFEGYLRRFPEKRRRGLSIKLGARWFPGLFKEVM
jgi:hypothetical protein